MLQLQISEITANKSNEDQIKTLLPSAERQFQITTENKIENEEEKNASSFHFLASSSPSSEILVEIYNEINENKKANKILRHEIGRMKLSNDDEDEISGNNESVKIEIGENDHAHVLIQNTEIISHTPFSTSSLEQILLLEEKERKEGRIFDEEVREMERTEEKEREEMREKERTEEKEREEMREKERTEEKEREEMREKERTEEKEREEMREKERMEEKEREEMREKERIEEIEREEVREKERIEEKKREEVREKERTEEIEREEVREKERTEEKVREEVREKERIREKEVLHNESLKKSKIILELETILEREANVNKVLEKERKERNDIKLNKLIENENKKDEENEKKSQDLKIEYEHLKKQFETAVRLSDNMSQEIRKLELIEIHYKEKEIVWINDRKIWHEESVRRKRYETIYLYNFLHFYH